MALYRERNRYHTETLAPRIERENYIIVVSDRETSSMWTFEMKDAGVLTLIEWEHYERFEDVESGDVPDEIARELLTGEHCHEVRNNGSAVAGRLDPARCADEYPVQSGTN